MRLAMMAFDLVWFQLSPLVARCPMPDVRGRIWGHSPMVADGNFRSYNAEWDILCLHMWMCATGSLTGMLCLTFCSWRGCCSESRCHRFAMPSPVRSPWSSHRAQLNAAYQTGPDKFDMWRRFGNSLIIYALCRNLSHSEWARAAPRLTGLSETICEGTNIRCPDHPGILDTRLWWYGKKKIEKTWASRLPGTARAHIYFCFKMIPGGGATRARGRAPFRMLARHTAWWRR